VLLANCLENVGAWLVLLVVTLVLAAWCLATGGSAGEDLKTVSYNGNECLLARDQNRDGIIFPQAEMDKTYRHPVPLSQFKKCTGVALLVVALVLAALCFAKGGSAGETPT